MRISFDLDDTLICYDSQVPREPSRAPFWWRWKQQEPLRLGIVALAEQLQNAGHDLMIYTTSARDPKQVKRWLGFYGFQAKAVINADTHDKLIPRSQQVCSKMPSRFGVDLHIDNEDFVELSRKFGFRWLLIEPHDLDWTTRILEAVADIENQKR